MRSFAGDTSRKMWKRDGKLVNGNFFRFCISLCDNKTLQLFSDVCFGIFRLIFPRTLSPRRSGCFRCGRCRNFKVEWENGQNLMSFSVNLNKQAEKFKWMPSMSPSIMEKATNSINGANCRTTSTECDAFVMTKNVYDKHTLRSKMENGFSGWTASTMTMAIFKCLFDKYASFHHSVNNEIK